MYSNNKKYSKYMYIYINIITPLFTLFYNNQPVDMVNITTFYTALLQKRFILQISHFLRCFTITNPCNYVY